MRYELGYWLNDTWNVIATFGRQREATRKGERVLRTGQAVSVWDTKKAYTCWFGFSF